MKYLCLVSRCFNKINKKLYSTTLIAESSTQSKRKDVIKRKVINDLPPVGKLNTQPLTDTFGRNHTYLRISLSEKCNLRCTYCMPAAGVELSSKSQLLTTEEILYLARIFVEQGVKKIRLTGGEPTIRKDIVDIIKNLKSIPNLEQIGITTNGLVLTKLLVPMQRAGLDAINISLDTLDPKKFEQITRRKGYERVIAGIDLALQLGYKPKINCVLMKNFNDNEICDFVEFTKSRGVDIRFIEYMPFTGNQWQTEKMVSFRDTLKIIYEKWPNFQALPNGPNDTSKAYAVPGHVGQIGFITSMTEHFCSTCNRLRLTADGNLKVCLFGNKEISLRDAIRNKLPEDELIALISSAVQRKKKQHADFLQTSSVQSDIKLQIPTISTSFLLPDIIFATRKSEIFKRLYSSSSNLTSKILTHVDAEGKAKMVSVTSKPDTKRVAEAEATVIINDEITQLISENNIKKGDVLSIAQMAGILGAKKTSELIPLCHNIFLSHVDVNVKLDIDRKEIRITSKIQCTGKTGVEMEALTAVSIAALTVYDMCKSISHNIIIHNIHLVEKSGGKTYYKKSILSTNDDMIGVKMKQFSGPLDNEENFYPIHL